MSNIFAKTEPLVLQTVNTSYDGIKILESHDIKGRMISQSAGMTDGDIQELYCSAIFLIPPDSPAPRPGDRIEHNAVVYDVSIVEKKCDLSGKLISYRCLCGKI